MIRNTKGFTLIELMIVVVIIGILAAIAIPKFSSVSASAKEAEAKPILKQLYTLQERHVQKTGQYATLLNELEGGSANFVSKYYEFDLTADPSGASFVACAAPKDESWGLHTYQIDSDGIVSEGSCGA